MKDRRTIIYSVLILAVIVFVRFSYDALAGPASPPQTPMVIDSAASSAFTTAQVAMTQAAAAIKAAPTTGHSRYSITIVNMGTSTVYIGPANTVTSSTGFPLAAGQSITLDRSYSAVYGICATGQTSTVAYIEEAK